MFVISKKINTKYAMDFCGLYQHRNFDDGIDFFVFDVSLDLYELDHNPRFSISLRIINFTIFEFEIYNMFHLTNNDENDISNKETNNGGKN